MAIFSDVEEFLRAWPSGYGTKDIHAYLAAQGASHVGMVKGFSVTVAHSDVALAATKTLVAPAAGETWRLHTLFLLGPFTNFHSGGDRLLAIKSGTAIYSVIPNATLESLAAARWGDTALPFPATAAWGTTAFSYANPLVAAYSGGTTDHSAGSLVLQGLVERVT